jgi:hypothetical protein
MSNINTNAININYPIPGVNNSTQGFRDNFASIKTNLDTATSEITDLQSKVVVKSALGNISLNNDMGNTLISNAAVRGFRATTYSLTSSIPTMPEVELVNVSRGDVQYGTIVGDTQFAFAGWSPTGTESKLTLMLSIANSDAKIFFPNTVYNSSAAIVSGMSSTVRLLEGYGSDHYPSHPSTSWVSVNHTNYVSVPPGVSELQFVISTVTCGTTLDITPTNRNRTASQIELRDTPPVLLGEAGDRKGMLCMAGGTLHMCVNDYYNPTTVGSIVAATAATWVSDNTVLPLNRFGIESDNPTHYKRGDGVNGWNSLPYYACWKHVSTTDTVLVRN